MSQRSLSHSPAPTARTQRHEEQHKIIHEIDQDDPKQRLQPIVVDHERHAKNQAAFAALHGKIRDLTSQNQSLLLQNKRLTERMKQL